MVVLGGGQFLMSEVLFYPIQAWRRALYQRARGVHGMCGARARAPSTEHRALSTNHSTEMCSGSEAGSYLRLIDLCITQL